MSLELAKRFKAEADIPTTVSQGGNGGTIGTTVAPAPDGGAFNDLRLGARVELTDKSSMPSIAVAVSAWLPTGNDNNYAGAGTARVAPCGPRRRQQSRRRLDAHAGDSQAIGQTAKPRPLRE